jgi:hypothetical protein
MAYILEIDRRRELIAALRLDDSMLDRSGEIQNETQDVKFNPFHSNDFIIIILEWCPPETLSKLYRTNKYIRSIIAENSQYLIQISEFKYRTVRLRYENLMKAHKAIIFMTPQRSSRISKAIREEDDSTSDVMNRINNLSMANNYMGYRANKYQSVLNIPETAQTENIGRILKPAYDIDNLDKTPSLRNNSEEDKEPDLDDLFERRKLESLKALHHNITQHQMRVKKELPVLNERQSKKKKFKKSSSFKSELDLELNFKDMQTKRQSMIDQRQDELNRK